MITIQEWNAMSGKEQTLWLEENKPGFLLKIDADKLIHQAEASKVLR